MFSAAAQLVTQPALPGNAPSRCFCSMRRLTRVSVFHAIRMDHSSSTSTKSQLWARAAPTAASGEGIRGWRCCSSHATCCRSSWKSPSSRHLFVYMCITKPAALLIRGSAARSSPCTSFVCGAGHAEKCVGSSAARLSPVRSMVGGGEGSCAVSFLDQGVACQLNGVADEIVSHSLSSHSTTSTCRLCRRRRRPRRQMAKAHLAPVIAFPLSCRFLRPPAYTTSLERAGKAAMATACPPRHRARAAAAAMASANPS